MAAHIASPSTHRLFSNLKRWGLGVSHGLRKTDLQHYLDEFMFRFNRRQTRRAAFETLLGIGARTLRRPTTSGSANTPNPTTISTTGLSCISLSHNSFSGFPGFAGDFPRNPQTGYVKLTQPVVNRGLRIGSALSARRPPSTICTTTVPVEPHHRGEGGMRSLLRPGCDAEFSAAGYRRAEFGCFSVKLVRSRAARAVLETVEADQAERLAMASPTVAAAGVGGLAGCAASLSYMLLSDRSVVAPGRLSSPRL
jgi:hypothetical protein